MSLHETSDRAARIALLKSAGFSRRPARTKPRNALSRETLIADFLAICRLDPAVEILHCPANVATFNVGGREIDHVAEFEIIRDGAPMLVDVVSEPELAHHPLRAVLVAGAAESLDGRPFTVEAVSAVRAEPRFTTVKLIMACRRTPVSAGDRVRVLHHLDECGTAPLVECAGVVQNSRDGVAAVLALATEGLVAIDISRPILPETPVRRRRIAFPDDRTA
jgi:hypothetical protein